MGNRIQSHHEPMLYLSSHLKQVWTAAYYLLQCHSTNTNSRRSETEKVLRAMVDCHDIGKGSDAFQQYIKDPPNYTGDPQEKSHASLSAGIGLLWAKQENWPPLHALALAQAVAGHHSGFATLDELLEEKLRNNESLREEQWQQLDRQQMSQEIGLDLLNLAGTFRDGRQWLSRAQRQKRLLESLNDRDKIDFRVWTTYLFSILLEADKAFLALHQEKVKEYLSQYRPNLAINLVDNFLQELVAVEINEIRNLARENVLNNLNSILTATPNARLFTVTLPTGVGKTLVAASWALAIREKLAVVDKPPQIIIVLPFLSIIDQTVKLYRKLLNINLLGQSESLMTIHSLSERSYNLDGEHRSQQFSDFFIDTWRSEIIITTFDQLLMAIFSKKTKHLMRFHHLLDALIIFDEVQTLPCNLWHPVGELLAALCREGNSRILMMSATQPNILPDALELVGNRAAVIDIFQRFSRYRILFKHRTTISISDFIDDIISRIPQWLQAGQRVLITLNTRASARRVFETIKEIVGKQIPLFLISADLIPLHRLRSITEIKKNLPCIVVSTQCIEAGVDIDMDYVIRDFAPFDSIIQIAGRCNRNNLKPRGSVEVIHLLSDKGRKYDEMIYHNVHLNQTYSLLENVNEILEEDIFSYTEQFFNKLKENRNLGEKSTETFANWTDTDFNIHKELRGSDEKIEFLVLIDESIDQEVSANQLLVDIKDALNEKDRWKRRSRLRTLANQIQLRTVSIYANKKINPEDYASPLARGRAVYFWLLDNQYYHPDSGLNLRLEEEESVCVT